MHAIAISCQKNDAKAAGTLFKLRQSNAEMNNMKVQNFILLLMLISAVTIPVNSHGVEPGPGFPPLEVLQQISNSATWEQAIDEQSKNLDRAKDDFKNALIEEKKVQKQIEQKNEDLAKLNQEIRELEAKKPAPLPGDQQRISESTKKAQTTEENKYNEKIQKLNAQKIEIEANINQLKSNDVFQKTQEAQKTLNDAALTARANAVVNKDQVSAKKDKILKETSATGISNTVIDQIQAEAKYKSAGTAPQTSGSVRERKVLRETKNNWKDSKEKYEEGMKQYYSDLYEFEKSKEEVAAIEKEIAELQKKYPTDIFVPESASQDAKDAAQKKAAKNRKSLDKELAKISKKLEKAKERVREFEGKAEVQKKEQLESEFKKSAETASADISILDKDTRSRRKVAADLKFDKNGNLDFNATKKSINDQVKKDVLNGRAEPEGFKQKTKEVSPLPSLKMSSNPLNPSNSEAIQSKENAEKQKLEEQARLEREKAEKEKAANECDKAKMQIVAKLLNNPKNKKIYENMVRLAELKMAYRISQNKSDHFEAFVKKQGLHTKMKDDSEFQANLNEIYTEYGTEDDLKKLEVLEKNFQYGKKELRLNNASASAVILYLSQHEGPDAEAKFTKEDAAVIWAQQRLQNKKIGTASGNLMNFSTRVCRLVKGRICGGSGASTISLSQIEKLSASNDTAMESALSEAAQETIQSNPQCFKECTEAQPKLGTESIAEIKSKLAKLVGKGTLNSSDNTYTLKIKSAAANSNGFAIQVEEVSPSGP